MSRPQAPALVAHGTEVGGKSKMASRGGFLVKDSALRSRHPIRYHSQPKVQKKKKKKKPEWDVSRKKLSSSLSVTRTILAENL